MINDPNLPSFECDEYLDLKATRNFTQLVYDGPMPDTAHHYSKFLPIEQKEPNEAYRARLNASIYLWNPKYKTTIDRFAAMLCAIHHVDIPQSLEDSWDDVDLRGNSMSMYAMELNKKALNHGRVYVLVEYARSAIAENSYEEQGISTRPYLVSFSVIDVPNYSVEVINGIERLTHITIREEIELPDGIYGNKRKIIYRVLVPGYSQLWEIIKDKKGKEMAVPLEEPREILDRNGNLLTEIPIASYGSNEPPLKDLARLSIHLWQIESDRHNVMHRINLPTPVIADNPITDELGTKIPRQVVLGPNAVIDLSPEGKAYFIEPTGAALSATKEAIDDVKRTMDKMGLDFLQGQLNTATEANLQGVGTQASLKGMVSELNSLFSSIKRLWCLFTLESDTGSISVDEKLMQMPLTDATGRLIYDLMDSGKIPESVGLSELQKGKVLSEEIDLSAISSDRVNGSLQPYDILSQLKSLDVLPTDFNINAALAKLYAETPE